MRLSIHERLKRLENKARALVVNLFPPDDDGFIHALCGDRAELYRRGEGYDVMTALSDTAKSDWAEYKDNAGGV